MTILNFRTKQPPFIERQQVALAYVRHQKSEAKKHKLTYANGTALGLTNKQLIDRLDMIEKCIRRAGRGDIIDDNICECHYFYSAHTRIMPQHIPSNLPFFVYYTGTDKLFWYELATTLTVECEVYCVSSKRLTSAKVDGHTLNVAIRTSALLHLPSLKAIVDSY